MNRFHRARAQAHKAVSNMTTTDLVNIAVSTKAQKEFLDDINLSGPAGVSESQQPSSRPTLEKVGVSNTESGCRAAQFISAEDRADPDAVIPMDEMSDGTANYGLNKNLRDE